MNECLITKIKDTSVNSNLKELGHMQIVVKELSESQLTNPEVQQAIRFGAISGNITVKIIGDGYMATSLANLDDPTKRFTTRTVGTTLTPLYFPNGNYIIDISPKYNIKGCSRLATDAGLYLKTPFNYDINDLKFAQLTYFVSYRGSTGNIKNLSNCNMIRLYLRYSQVTGDISVLSSCVSSSCVLLDIGSTKVYGDVSALSHLRNVTDLRLNNTDISGDVSALSGLTSLTNISIGNTKLSGDIGSFGSIETITALSVKNTDISGDIRGLAGMLALTDLHVNNIVYGDFYNLVEEKRLQAQTVGAINIYDSITESTKCTFRGIKWTTNPYGNLYLKWDDHKAAILSTNSWNASVIVVYGATQEELDDWETKGRTVYVID